MIVHQWDAQEESSRPWRACIDGCRVMNRKSHGRLSSLIIYAGLRDRHDRKSIPLPYPQHGGILLNNRLAQVDCLYGIDGSTWQLDEYPFPGCSRQFCDARQGYQEGGCGFSGVPATAFGPADMKELLEWHKEHGAQYKGPELTDRQGANFHSGYTSTSRRWRGAPPLRHALLTSHCLSSPAGTTR